MHVCLYVCIHTCMHTDVCVYVCMCDYDVMINDVTIYLERELWPVYESLNTERAPRKSW